MSQMMGLRNTEEAKTAASGSWLRRSMSIDLNIKVPNSEEELNMFAGSYKSSLGANLNTTALFVM